MPSYIEESFAPRISRLRARFRERRFHKKSIKDRLPSIFAGRLYLLQTHLLGQNPGIRHTGIGEVLRRIVGKTIAGYLKEEIKEAAGPLQRPR